LPEWHDELNDRQLEAVTYKDGPLLILAGAGSGKTRALTYRIAHLIYERGVAPYQILAITFTNKAAAEMKERVGQLLGLDAPEVWVSTFHSTCARILRREAAHVGYGRDFAIYDTADQRELVRDILAELRWDAKKFPPPAFLAAISTAKNELLRPEEFARRAAARSGDAWAERTARVFRSYQRQLERNNAMDFDDLIANVVRLFEEHPDVLAAYQRRFLHVLVDEYQDTNHAQYRLVRALAAAHRNITVVGDDDQSIYAFRGADTRNILEFERDYPDAHVVKLEQNYRSTVTVLQAANSLVGHNDMRKPKELWTENEQGEPLRYYQATDQRDEAAHLAYSLAGLRQQGEALGDCVVLYRTNAQSRLVEEALTHFGLPYQVVGGLRFYDRKEIKDLIAYMRLVLNPADAVSLHRVINVPRRGVGPATWARLVQLSEDEALPILDAMGRMAQEGTGLPGPTRQALRDLSAVIGELRAASETARPDDVLEALLESTGYRRELEQENTMEAAGRLDNLDELARLAGEHAVGAEDPSLRGFLEQVALVSDIDSMDDEATDRVVLMTMHTAKGLEFDNVFLIGLDETVFPHERSFGTKREIEEERRLCYVALTRARRRLFLSSATMRIGFRGESEPLMPSRFLAELPPHLVQVIGRGGRAAGHLGSAQLARQMAAGGAIGRRARPVVSWQDAAAAGQMAADAVTVARGAGAPRATGPAAMTEQDLPGPGEKVRHSKWGEGTVVSVAKRPDPADSEITVAFPGLGIKRLVAGFARLEKLS